MWKLIKLTNDEVVDITTNYEEIDKKEDWNKLDSVFIGSYMENNKEIKLIINKKTLEYYKVFN